MMRHPSATVTANGGASTVVVLLLIIQNLAQVVHGVRMVHAKARIERRVLRAVVSVVASAGRASDGHAGGQAHGVRGGRCASAVVSSL